MVGRPRKQGVRRYANGKVARDSVAQEAPSPTLVKRASLMAMLGLAAPEYGTVAGLYFLRRIIDGHELEAARRFAALRQQYVGAVGGPRAPVSVDAGGTIKQAPIDPDSSAGEWERDRHIDVLRRYNDAHTALRSVGRGVEDDVILFCQGVGQTPTGHEGLLRVRRGLGALVILWKISGKK